MAKIFVSKLFCAINFLEILLLKEKNNHSTLSSIVYLVALFMLPVMSFFTHPAHQFQGIMEQFRLQGDLAVTSANPLLRAGLEQITLLTAMDSQVLNTRRPFTVFDHHYCKEKYSKYLSRISPVPIYVHCFFFYQCVPL